jgi:glycine betaine/proline transport system ATP-binding protein
MAATTIFITHDLNEARKPGDRLAILLDGKLMQTGTPQELASQPLKPKCGGVSGALTAYAAFSRGAALRPTQREERVWKSNLRLLGHTKST